MHVTFGGADQEQRAWICDDFILLIGVLIQNRDDTANVLEAGYPTQTSTSAIYGRTSEPCIVFMDKKFTSTDGCIHGRPLERVLQTVIVEEDVPPFCSLRLTFVVLERLVQLDGCL